MKKTLSYMFLLIILLGTVTSCSIQPDLKAHEVAVINGDSITVQDIEKKLLSFQLEKILFEYNRFRNNIYPKLELLQIRPDLIDRIIDKIKTGDIGEAKTVIASLDLPNDRENLKYFALKEINRYEELLNKQDVVVAFHQLLKEKIILQEVKLKAIEPTSDELEKAYILYISNVNKNMENNIYSRYFYKFMKSKEQELFHLNTDEIYENYLKEKIKHQLIMENFKKEVGIYSSDLYIQRKLEASTILINPKYEQYKNKPILP